MPNSILYYKLNMYNNMTNISTYNYEISEINKNLDNINKNKPIDTYKSMESNGV